MADRRCRCQITARAMGEFRPSAQVMLLLAARFEPRDCSLCLEKLRTYAAQGPLRVKACSALANQPATRTSYPSCPFTGFCRDPLSGQHAACKAVGCLVASRKRRNCRTHVTSTHLPGKEGPPSSFRRMRPRCSRTHRQDPR